MDGPDSTDSPDSRADDATLPARPTAVTPGTPTTPELERYELADVLGRGGMGEVRLARDARIDREVAVKLMRGGQNDPETVARFLREARVQGALEHPAVVPVHDLGIDANGHPFFVMKRLTGTTLADVLAQRSEAWPRRLLLARFVDVCLALAFAHERGVVHRDIKPANIMLGDFGEAYVLDWGLARISDRESPIVGVASISGDETHTAAGALLGTPGYLAPEQARGEAIDQRADIYGLGCVLFEILAGQPALPRGMAAITEALAADELRPSTRGHDIPPELDELCARATAQDPGRRPTARALADGIQAYLDGDRDLTARRELAQQHARRAREALVRSGDDARAEAMREAGRAIALDAQNGLAQSVLSRLLIQGPEVIPEGARIAADEERAVARMQVIRWAWRGYVGLAGVVLLLFTMPLRTPGLVIGAAVYSLGMAACGYYLGKRVLPMRTRWYLAFLAMNSGLLFLCGLLFGSLFLMPIFLVGSFSAFLVQPTTYRPWIILVGHLAPFALLLGLEVGGLVPRSFAFEHGELVLRTVVLELTPITTTVLFALALVAQLSNNWIILLTTRRAQEQAQDRVHAQRWHLGQLVPTGAPDLQTDRIPLQALPSERTENRSR